MKVITQTYLAAAASVLFGSHAAVLAQTQLPLITFVQASNVACKVGRANVKPGETVTFQGGGCADGLVQGPGLAQWYLDGKPTLRFVGRYERGLLEGKVTMTGADGDRYEGEYKGGLRHGHGIYTSANGARFEGEYRNNQRMEPGTVSAAPPQPQASQAPTTTAPTQRIEGAVVPASMPSESNARSVFEDLYSEEIKKGLMIIDSFAKTNGQKRNLNGVEAYVVEYSANVTYPKGALPQCAGEEARQHYNQECFLAMSQGWLIRKVGQKEKMEGHILFEKTEKGWRGQDGKIY
jgi:hypothetical protein